jgi:hypothetical protein
MSLMISQTSSRFTCGATHSNAIVDILSYATGECALGQVLVARSVKGVCAILIGVDHANWRQTSPPVFSKPSSSRTRPSSTTIWPR